MKPIGILRQRFSIDSRMFASTHAQNVPAAAAAAEESQQRRPSLRPASLRHDSLHKPSVVSEIEEEEEDEAENDDKHVHFTFTPSALAERKRRSEADVVDKDNQNE